MRPSRFEETEMAKSSSRRELVPGTLDMLVLHTLTLGALHGYAIAQHIEKLSEAVLQVEQGSLYPALERLQRQGFVTSKWGESPTGRRARYYTITASGRKQLGEEISEFDRAMLAINRVMRRA
jgi:PadR family transcriptional regulator PadR